MDHSFEELIKLIEAKTGFRCHSYKERPLTRRIRVRMRALGLNDFHSYYEYLTRNPEEFNILLKTLTINFSYFFRNPETFEYLLSEIMPILSKNERIVFWSAGCAQGEEPYSLAIIAAEADVLEKTTIYATDIDATALAKAEKGIYPSMVFPYTPQKYLDRYFIRSGDDYQIREQIKSAVRLIQLDLFDPFPYGPCDLIMCRNVLIYMGKEAQSRLLQRFHESLKSGGYLVIGKVELLLGIPEAKYFEVVNKNEHVYQKLKV